MAFNLAVTKYETTGDGSVRRVYPPRKPKKVRISRASKLKTFGACGRREGRQVWRRDRDGKLLGGEDTWSRTKKTT